MRAIAGVRGVGEVVEAVGYLDQSNLRNSGKPPTPVGDFIDGLGNAGRAAGLGEQRQRNRATG